MRRVLLAAAALAVLVGCGADRAATPPGDAKLARHVQNQSAAGGYSLARTLEEALPSTVYRDQHGSERRASEVAVIGSVTEVEEGYGFRDEGDRVAFAHPDARWRTIHLTVAADEVFGAGGGATFRVGLSSAADLDFDRAETELLAMDRVALVLGRRSAVFDYDPALHHVVLDGRLFAEVRPDGSLALPFMARDEANRWLATTRTVDDFRAQAGAERVVAVEERGGALYRAGEG